MKHCLSVLISCIALLSPPTFASSLLPAQTINAIETINNGQDIRFKFASGVKLEGCSSESVVVKDSAMSDRILSVALSAYHADHAVRFLVDGCTAGDMQGISVSISKN